ncbi:DUF3185 family protein [Marinoscillum furvescens]|uniref:Uncharacterized protein DUF3185 n=1 Tax=Marinoscillum furvescens DSM 4134 TaxID=1122208 RepID=A0A3D9LGV8_MARFU|nr:DUF3185 family protein [Marinoscillum furvescens]REE05837.1 uncharacterized protein DUF3185 [Marinoscillum furvescens DSM 4134]
MKSGLIRGIALIAIGIFLIYWAQSHSPKDLGQMIGNELTGSYTLSETWYYICMGGGILLGVVGVLRTFKSMK